MYSEIKDFTDKEKPLIQITDCLSCVACVHSVNVLADLRVLEVGGVDGIISGLLSNMCSQPAGTLCRAGFSM